MRDLETIAGSFVSDESRPKTKEQFVSLLDELKAAVRIIPSKFVDIDTSYKEIDQEEFKGFKSSISNLNNPEFEDELSALYEVLALYLLIKDRFGDAADWNLKQELLRLDFLDTSKENG